jgi:hypothetical protein
MAVFGVWRSWLARLVWDQEAGGSSPLTPTIQKGSAILSNPFEYLREDLKPKVRRSKFAHRNIFRARMSEEGGTPLSSHPDQ